MGEWVEGLESGDASAFAQTQAYTHLRVLVASSLPDG